LAKVALGVIAIDALENIEEIFEQLSIFVRGNLGFSFLRLFHCVCLYPDPLNVFKPNRFITSVVKLSDAHASAIVVGFCISLLTNDRDTGQGRGILSSVL